MKLNQSLTDLFLINCLTNHRANTVDQNEAIYGLLQELKIFTKFNIYGLYSTHIALYSLALVFAKLI